MRFKRLCKYLQINNRLKEDLKKSIFKTLA